MSPASGIGRTRRIAAAVVAIAAVAGSAACATTPPATADGGGHSVRVVAAENFWGSIAAQLGGTHAQVTSIIANPDTDPHAYEPTPADARSVATAQYAIVNGAGYDAWAPKLLAATTPSPSGVLTVGDLVGVPQGGNPHRWYSPTDVHRVIDRITADYQRIDPADAGYFAQRKTDFEQHALARYDGLIGEIKAKYAGTPVGASESIVSPLAAELGLRMATPEGFLDAISEGADPTAADKATVDAQIQHREIKAYLYNSQNSTPDVAAQVAAAKANGIPVASVTETPAPANSTFQDWQAAQLDGIEHALAQGTGH